ncbi:LuxR C-terminal-related transcriptional regulator [Streptomyces sp. NPDC056399]|uniref:LuxR C-terminal-related transcriptional regulator n=1 Tax=Streptomyces sp. NPDC056399 TaxID=3345807 RepID=UPI0035DEA4FE
MTALSLPIRQISLAAREREALMGVAQGLDVPAVAASLGIAAGTVTSYLKSAKAKLHGVREIPFALAVAYATDSIPAPRLRDEVLDLPVEQSELIPLLAQGMKPVQIARKLNRVAKDVRRFAAELLVSLGARTYAHVVTLAWEHRLLTAADVTAWLAPSAPTGPAGELRERLGRIIGWDVTGSGLPETLTIVSMVKDLVREGIGIYNEVSQLTSSIPRDSKAALEAAVVLGDIRRLRHVPRLTTQVDAAEYAQSVAREVTALLLILGMVQQEHARRSSAGRGLHRS